MPEIKVPIDETDHRLATVFDTETPTGPQVLNQPDDFDFKLPYQYETRDWFRRVREMRKDPTVALVRQLAIVPAILGPWALESNEDAPDDAKQLIQEYVVPWKNYLIRTVFHSCMDFGWSGLEKVFKLNKDGKVVVGGFKSLLPDFTYILADSDTGQFMGFSQDHPEQTVEVAIELPESFLHAWDVEGQYYYGQSMMANIDDVIKWWNDANTSAARYDKKVAGAYWIIKYPDGFSKINGVETPNDQVARKIAADLQASGTIILPRRIAGLVKDLNNTQNLIEAWEIILESSAGTTTNGFTDRLSYLDKLKVRGLGFPERSILEGQFGTKAEAEAHADFAIAGIEIRHDDFLLGLNWHLVNQLLRINFGENADGSVWITRGPIADSSRNYLQEIYKMILQNPSGWMEEFDQIDKLQLKHLTRVPIDEEVVQERKDSDALLDPQRLRQSVREGQHPPVGDGGQRRGPDGDLDEGDGGDRLGGRTNR